MSKKREIEIKYLINFFCNVFNSFKIDITPSKVAEVIYTIYECYEDNTMFDNWFCNIDVMN